MKKLKLFIVPLLAFMIAIGGAFAGSLGSKGYRLEDVNEFMNEFENCGPNCSLIGELSELDCFPRPQGDICKCELAEDEVDAGIPDESETACLALKRPSIGH